jgi:putative ABC transport system ATP-binding protein
MSNYSDSIAVFARGLVRHFEGGRVRAVDGADLEIEAGEFVAVCGPSGCGKTTLLHLIAGIERPDAGELRVDGKLVNRFDDADAVELRRSAIGLVFQLHNLLPDLTALENVQVPMLGARLTAPARRDRALSLLDRVGLTDRGHALPTVLSGGERQRVAIARALANEPSIILADEPTGSLDSQSGERVLDLLEELQRESRTTLIIVTHEAHVAERAARTLHMLDGKFK